MLPPARTVPIATTTTDLLLVGGACILFGWSIGETTGGAGASVRLIDGGDTGGAVIAQIALASGASSHGTIPHPCLRVPGGLFLDVVSGSVAGAVWVATIEQVLQFAEVQGVIPIWAGGE